MATARRLLHFDEEDEEKNHNDDDRGLTTRPLRPPLPPSGHPPPPAAAADTTTTTTTTMTPTSHLLQYHAPFPHYRHPQQQPLHYPLPRDRLSGQTHHRNSVVEDATTNTTHPQHQQQQKEEDGDCASAELPFLVTQYLTHYSYSGGMASASIAPTPTTATTPTTTTAAALERIRQAASELASAFETLGAFGTTARPQLSNATTSSTSPSFLRFINNNSNKYNHNHNYNYMVEDENDMDRLPPHQLLQAASFADVRRRYRNNHQSGGNHHSYKRRRNPSSSSSSSSSSWSLSRLPIDPLEQWIRAAVTAQSVIESAPHVNNHENVTTHGTTTIATSSFPSTTMRNPIWLRAAAAADSSALGFSATSSLNLNRSSSDLNTTTNNNYNNNNVILTLESTLLHEMKQASDAVRTWLQMRDAQVMEEERIRQIEQSLQFQYVAQSSFAQQRNFLLRRIGDECTTTTGGSTRTAIITSAESADHHPHPHEPPSFMATQMRQLDDIADGEQNCLRVIAQLERDCEHRTAHRAISVEVWERHTRTAATAYASLRAFMREYCDPLCLLAKKKSDTVAGLSLSSQPLLRNHLVMSLCARERGFIMRPYQQGPARTTGCTQAAMIRQRQALLYNRLSCVATINTHLMYPIYCLRFDKTGRYFVTGADDYLVRIFCLLPMLPSSRTAASIHSTTVRQATQTTGTGMGQSSSSSLSYSYMVGPRSQGAILVATLRGHAGVINDIDVSSDNSLLATASEDGDCRIWGLKDGCPVAILRGHVGGAHMVSWSKLTPYRLVTTGADGYARSWDVREACLKRYGKVIGKRPEYRQTMILTQRSEIATESASTRITPTTSDSSSPIGTPRHCTPLLNAHQIDTRNEGVASVSIASPIESVLREEQGRSPLHTRHSPNPQLPSIPVPLPPLPVGAGRLNIPSDLNNDENNPGAFVANDAIDEGVQLLFRLKHGALQDENSSSPAGIRSRRSPVKVICLARCPHGGYFATGSDDGVCRVWKDEDDPCVLRIDDHFYSKNQLQHVEAPSSIPSSGSYSNRLLLTLKSHDGAVTDLQYSYAGDRLLSASQKDGVARIWNCDITRHNRENSRPSSERVPNYVLIQLTNPHKTLLNAINPQGSRSRSKSTASSISCDVASWVCDDTKVVTSQSELLKQRGTDIVPGSQFIFLWNSFNGNCLLCIVGAHDKQCPCVIPHPFHPSILCSAGADGFAKLWDYESGKVFFSHKNRVEFGPIDPNYRDDPCGFLDGSFSPDGNELVLTDDAGRVSIFNSSRLRNEGYVETPTWMNEQYFSNDYYDLLYDTNGYCIEKGSALPPHLAPTGVRCSHGGIPHVDAVTQAFKKLVGPMPISERQARCDRMQIFRLGRVVHRRVDKARNIVGRFDPNSTLMINGKGFAGLIEAIDCKYSVAESSARYTSRVASTTSHIDRLSSNAGDYDDSLTREDAVEDYEDPDDEEYEQVHGNRNSLAGFDEDESEMEDDENDDFGDSPVRSRRVSSRFIEEDNIGSSDSELDEFVSTNKTPSGPFVVDYETYFFRMTSKGGIAREWLMRAESNLSFAGRKSYAPQLGDSVVYIPRAHYETIKLFPLLPRPWLQWPRSARWPIVRCSIQSLRYRFPYKEYYKSGQGNLRSIVVLLTLEVTGVPDVPSSADYPYSWPSPVFTEPNEPTVFEMSMFLSDGDDFLIPAGLFEQRLSRLAMYGKEGSFVEAFYKEGDSSNDPIFRPFRGRIESFEPSLMQDIDLRISGSGYQSIIVRWTEDDSEDQLSPWELDVIADAVDGARRSRLSDDEKRKIQKALDSLKDIDGVFPVFYEPVDVMKYSDYDTMVEIPMDLSFISSRVETDYYVSLLSVVSDVKVVYENCVKYNGADDVLSALASQMFDKFSKDVLAFDELRSFQEFDKLAQGNASAWRLLPGESQLENLPIPRHRQRSSRINRSSSRVDGARTHRPRTYQAVVASPPHGRGLRRSSRNTTIDTSLRGQRFHNHRSGAGTRAVSSNQGDQRSDSVVVRLRMPIGSQRGQSSTRSTNVSRSTRSVPRVANSRHNQCVRGSTRSQRFPDRSRREEDRVASTLMDELDQESFVATRSRGSAGTRQSMRAVSVTTPLRPTRASAAPIENHQDSDRETTSHSHAMSTSSDESANLVKSRTTTRSMQSSCKRNTFHSSSDSDGSVVCGRSTDEDNNAVGDQSDESVHHHPEQKPPVTRNSSLNRKTVKSGSTTVTRREKTYVSSISPKPIAANSESPRRSSLRGSSRVNQVVYAEINESESARSGNMSNEDGRVTSESRPASRKRLSSRSRSPTSLSTNVAVANVPALKKNPSASFESTNNSRPMKKEKRETEAIILSLPKKWPDIDMKHITEVVLSVVERMTSIDDEGIFAIPVPEAFPEIEDSYLTAIEQPMDFRTIQEDRLPSYQSIQELQQDLILTFRNCMQFNRQGNHYWNIAKTMMEMINDVFLDVCKEHDVLLPRRWCP